MEFARLPCISFLISLHLKTRTMSVTVSKKTKIADLKNYRLRVSILDGRSFTGQLLAFDSHMNLVLADTEEARIPKKAYRELTKNKVNGPARIEEVKRFLGLVILRGEQVVNITVKSGPTADIKKRLSQLKLGDGVSKPLKVPVSQKAKLKHNFFQNKK